MHANARKWQWLDKGAMLLSGLCVVHCVATVVLLGALSAFGHLFADPRIHEVGLALATLLGAVALGSGLWRHRNRLPMLLGVPGLSLMTAALFVDHGVREALLTIAGVSLVALAHLLNARMRLHPRVRA